MSHHPHLANIEQDIENGLSLQAAPYILAPAIVSDTALHAPPPLDPGFHIYEPSAPATAAVSRTPSIKTSSPSSNHNNEKVGMSEATLPTSNQLSIPRDEKVGMSEATLTTSNNAPEREKAASLRNGSSSPDGSTPPDTKVEHDTSGLLHGLRLYLVFLSLMLSVFMFALDQSIVSTAIPQIVSQFQAFDQVAWIITAYFLSQCGLILVVGQLLTVIKAKYMLLVAIFFFELGSLLCGLANGMVMLIIARAIQGIGASGMFVSILAVIATITTLQQRPAFMSAFGIVFVISSVVGPLLGGVFTQRVTWRWAFYINLPIGGLAAIAVVFLLPAHDTPKEAVGDGIVEEELSFWRKISKMDWIGSALIICIITCLLLALQWGGNEYPWGNWRIILLFILGGLLVPVFGWWQYHTDKRALIPLALLKNRTQVASAGAMFFFMMGMLGGTYQLPLFYQAVRGHSPQQSGIDIIAFMLAICIGIFVSGGAATATGYYWPWIIVGPPIAAVGFGLLFTIDTTISNAKIIGYQILAGFGVGLAFQMALIAIQAEYHDRPHLIPQATGVVSFFQLTGAALGIGIINTVQSVYLNEEIPILAPNAPFELVRNSVAAIYTLPEELQGGVIDAYVIAITRSFIPIIASVCLAWIIAFFIRNHNMKKMTGGSAAAVAV